MQYTLHIHKRNYTSYSLISDIDKIDYTKKKTDFVNDKITYKKIYTKKYNDYKDYLKDNMLSRTNVPNFSF